MLHLNERKAGQSTPCRRPRSCPSSAWWRHCRFAFCLICINVKVITMQAGPARNVFIVLSHASMHSTAAFSPKKDSSRTRAAGAELWAVSCECDNAHSFAHSLLTRPSSTTRRQGDRATGRQDNRASLKQEHRPSSWCTQVCLLPLGCTSFEGKPKISTADQSQVPIPDPIPDPAPFWLTHRRLAIAAQAVFAFAWISVSTWPQMKSNVLIILPSKSFLSAFRAKQFPVTFAWQVPPQWMVGEGFFIWV